MQAEVAGRDSRGEEANAPRCAFNRLEPSSGSLLDQDFCVSGLPEALTLSPPARTESAAPPTKQETGGRLDRAATVERRLEQELSSLAIAVGREQDQR